MTKEKDVSLSFSVHNKEIMRLEKGKFFWKGQEVKDVNKIYERFSKWMDMAEEVAE